MNVELTCRAGWMDGAHPTTVDEGVDDYEIFWEVKFGRGKQISMQRNSCIIYSHASRLSFLVS